MVGGNNLIYTLNTSALLLVKLLQACGPLFLFTSLSHSLSLITAFNFQQEFEKPETWWMKAEKCQYACQI